MNNETTKSIIKEAVINNRSVIIRGYVKEGGEKQDYEVALHHPGVALRLVKQQTLEVFPRVAAEITARLTKEGKGDLAKSADFIGALSDLKGSLAGTTGAGGTWSGSGNLRYLGHCLHESDAGLVLAGVLRIAPARPDPRKEPLPDFNKKRGAGMSVSAVKDFFLAHTAYGSYIGRLNLYEGKFDSIELGQIHTRV